VGAEGHSQTLCWPTSSTKASHTCKQRNGAILSYMCPAGSIFQTGSFCKQHPVHPCAVPHGAAPDHSRDRPAPTQPPTKGTYVILEPLSLLSKPQRLLLLLGWLQSATIYPYTYTPPGHCKLSNHSQPPHPWALASDVYGLTKLGSVACPPNPPQPGSLHACYTVSTCLLTGHPRARHCGCSPLGLGL
jgi:hypothetical protein